MKIIAPNHLLIIIIVLFLAALFACDIGLHYTPRYWTLGPDAYWIHSYSIVEFAIKTVGGLVGSPGLSNELIVRNHSQNQTIRMLAVNLKTRTGDYKGNVNIAPTEPQQMNRGFFFWEFDKTIKDILIDPVELVLHFRIGDEDKFLSVPMDRL